MGILTVCGTGQPTSVYLGKIRYKFTETLEVPCLFCFGFRSLRLTSDRRINEGKGEGERPEEIRLVTGSQQRRSVTESNLYLRKENN